MKFGYEWQEYGLLKTALTHSSYGNEHGLEHNERLEFLGDSVLDLLAAEFLMANYPSAREGFMSQTRADLVKASSLALRAKALGLDHLIMVGRGATNLRNVESVLADLMEAVVGAAYMDGGLPAARQVAMAAGIFRV